MCRKSCPLFCHIASVAGTSRDGRVWMKRSSRRCRPLACRRTQRRRIELVRRYRLIATRIFHEQIFWRHSPNKRHVVTDPVPHSRRNIMTRELWSAQSRPHLPCLVPIERDIVGRALHLRLSCDITQLVVVVAAMSKIGRRSGCRYVLNQLCRCHRGTLFSDSIPVSGARTDRTPNPLLLVPTTSFTRGGRILPSRAGGTRLTWRRRLSRRATV